MKYFVLNTFGFALGLGSALQAGTIEFTGTFETEGQNMWGPSGQIEIVEDIWAVRTGVLEERQIGEIKEIDNPARATYDLAYVGCTALATYTLGAVDCREVDVPGLGTGPTAPTEPTKPTVARPPIWANPFDANVKEANRQWREYDLAAIKYDTITYPAYLAEVSTHVIAVQSCKAATGLTVEDCQNGFVALGAAPSETLADGAALTISNAELELGMRARLSVGDGEVDASQGFMVTLDVPDGEFQEGDILTIGTAGSIGDATLETRLDVLDAGLDALTKLTADVNVQQSTLGTETLNEDILNLSVQNDDGTAVATEMLGLQIGDGSISGNLFGLEGEVDLSDGISKQVRVPAIPDATGTLAKLLGFSVGDVTAYTPDLDLGEISGPAPLMSDSTPTDRTGSGETPVDYLKVDFDMDVITAFNGAPLGVGGSIPLALDVQMDLGDADIGAFFGITQKQKLEAGRIEVVLNFSIPTQVETAPGSGVFELVTQKVIDVGQDLRIRHPGDNLEVVPEYRLVDSYYSNLTESIMSQVVSFQLLNFSLGGAIPLALGIEGFTLFEDTIPLADPEVIGTLFDERFLLGGFETVSGQAFTLAQSPVSEVPLPSSSWLLFAGIGCLALRRRRTRV